MPWVAAAGFTDGERHWYRDREPRCKHGEPTLFAQEERNCDFTSGHPHDPRRTESKRDVVPSGVEKRDGFFGELGHLIREQIAQQRFIDFDFGLGRP